MKLWYSFSKPRFNKEIYAKLQRNAVFEVSPVEVHFAGFDAKAAHHQHLVWDAEYDRTTTTDGVLWNILRQTGRPTKQSNPSILLHFTFFSLFILTEAASARLCVGDPGRLQAQRVQILQWLNKNLQRGELDFQGGLSVIDMKWYMWRFLIDLKWSLVSLSLV